MANEMSNNSRESSIFEIVENIERYGYHIYMVAQGVCPRFLYTIGLKEKLGFDLIFPGTTIFFAEDIVNITSQFANSGNRSLTIATLGDFFLREVDSSWVSLMALGALDFYDGLTPFMQVCPGEFNISIDTPDLSQVWDPTLQPVWRWLNEPWSLPVPSTSSATTNIAALRGGRVTEAARWEVDEWELFSGSGPDTRECDIRILPLSTFLATDASIAEVITLDVGKAAWREKDEEKWHEWKVRL
jgi:hypothetical protein